MKLKKGSLFEKLKQENQSNSESIEVLDEVQNLIPKLKPNTELINKINQIYKLQKSNTLDNSNEIFEIINDKFEYEYPFCFNVFGSNNNYNLSHISLIKTEHLKNHIKREAELNEVQSNFNKAVEYIKKRDELISKKKTRDKTSDQLTKGCGAYIGIVFGGGLALFIILSFFVSYYAAGMLIYIIGASTILLTLYAVFRYFKTKELKKSISKINDLINIEVNKIKTKANNV